MILVNFSHPITKEQQRKIKALTNQSIEAILPVSSQFKHDIPFPEQITALVDAIGLSPEDWQTKPILVNPPGLSSAAVTLLAELHGRMGHFPSIVRIRPVPESNPPSYEVAEIIDLRTLRDKARADHR
jgi:hypothetical protein